MLTTPVVIISLVFTIPVILVAVLLFLGKKGRVLLKVLVPVLSLMSFLMVSWASYISMQNSINTAASVGLDTHLFVLGLTQRKLDVIKQLSTVQQAGIDCHQLVSSFGLPWRPKWVLALPATDKECPLSYTSCCMTIAQLVEDYLTYRDIDLPSDAEMASFFGQFVVSDLFLKFIAEYKSMYKAYTSLYISTLNEFISSNQWQSESDWLMSSALFVTTDKFAAITENLQLQN